MQTLTFSYHLSDLSRLRVDMRAGDRIALIGDLGAGKTTLAAHMIRSCLQDSSLIVKSPTYTYVSQYAGGIVHSDLWRVESPETLFLTGIHDFLSDPSTICLVEWPDRLGDLWQPTAIIHLSA